MNGAETTLSEIIAENIRNGKYHTITLKELESWCDRKTSLPSRIAKKVLITIKMFIIKLRKVIFKF